MRTRTRWVRPLVDVSVVRSWTRTRPANLYKAGDTNTVNASITFFPNLPNTVRDIEKPTPTSSGRQLFQPEPPVTASSAIEQLLANNSKLPSELFKSRLHVVTQLEKIVGYSFKNKKYAWEALQAKGSDGYAEGNRRLALLGDTVLKTKILSKWYHTTASAGVGNTLVEHLSRNNNLTTHGRRIGLDKLVVTNPSQRISGVAPSQIADAMEAVVGAVHADGGEHSLNEVIKTLGLDVHISA